MLAVRTARLEAGPEGAGRIALRADHPACEDIEVAPETDGVDRPFRIIGRVGAILRRT